MLWWDSLLLRQPALATARGKALSRDPKEITVWGLARQNFVSIHESSQITCSLWFCKGWCRSNEVSKTTSKANISHLHSYLMSDIPEVHVSYLTSTLLFLRRLVELRGRNSNGLWDVFHLEPTLPSSRTLCWGSSLLYRCLKGWFKTIIHLFLSNILQGNDPSRPCFNKRILHNGGVRRKRVK